MTDKPILFSAPMVRAILDGRKTQTRRVLKPQPVNSFLECRLRYAPGDRLWVREAVCWVSARGWKYRADQEDLSDYEADGERGRWRPSIHMPRSASRLTLTVTDVRVQRVQEISEADAVAEGIERLKSGRGYYDPTQSHGAVSLGHFCSKAKAAFSLLWDSINASRGYSWDANPWVVALTFDVEKRNIDEVTA